MRTRILLGVILVLSLLPVRAWSWGPGMSGGFHGGGFGGGFMGLVRTASPDGQEVGASHLGGTLALRSLVAGTRVSCSGTSSFSLAVLAVFRRWGRQDSRWGGFLGKPPSSICPFSACRIDWNLRTRPSSLPICSRPMAFPPSRRGPLAQWCRGRRSASLGDRGATARGCERGSVVRTSAASGMKPGMRIDTRTSVRDEADAYLSGCSGRSAFQVSPLPLSRSSKFIEGRPSRRVPTPRWDALPSAPFLLTFVWALLSWPTSSNRENSYC